MKTAPIEKRASDKVSTSKRRVWAFRAMAVLLGLSPLVLFEGFLRAVDWGRPSYYEDPFVGFSELHPLFVLNEDGTRYEIPRARQSHFCPESFAAKKGDREFRVFVLGGSTVFGRPYAKETSFTTWLELSLNAADPEHDYDVVNCGGVSYASYRLAPIMQELLARQPDLFIFYEGHNEFLEDRTYQNIKQTPPALAAVHERVARSHTYTLIRALAQRLRGRDETEVLKARPSLGPEADARLDWGGGMALFHRDEAWRRDVIHHFEFNLRRMVDMCRQAGVPLVFVNPVSNLDWPPFKVEHRAGLVAADRARFDDLMAQALARYGDAPAEAVTLVRQAIDIDRQHAGAWFNLGQAYMQLGLFPQAREALVRARDLDICPLRILSPMNELVLRVAEETGTPLVDADELFTSRSRGHIAGGEWLLDHVHPTLEGHQLLADAIADKLVAIGLVEAIDTWHADKHTAYGRHLDSLDTFYYAKAEERLRNEQGWAHGRATKERSLFQVE